MGGKYASQCYNKYTQLSEPVWTPEQEAILGKYWEEHQNNFNILDVIPLLEGHSKRGSQFKLERLTERG